LWALVDLGAELVEVSLAAGDGGFGLLDVVGEAVDLVEDRGFLFAAVAAELGERAEIGEPFLGSFEAVVGPVEVFLRGGEGEFGLSVGRPPVGWPMAQRVAQCGLFAEESLDVAGGIVDGEAGVGLAAEGVEDFSPGGALVGEDAAVVDLGEAGDVPGVGGVAASALAV
jgi:hypothetical protein